MIGVVADDITGANDIGSMFANSGCKVDVFAYDSFVTFPLDSPDVLVLNTNSRLDTAELAYAKVRRATSKLRELKCNLFFNKTCSVFRGNIGAQFDAMLDELNRELAIVVLGFPKNGRQTRKGIHFVHGVPLNQSEFRNDPIHPMTESDLVKILGNQTKRKVAAIEHSVVETGSQAVRHTIESMRQTYNYLIIDVENQDSLKTIANAVKDRYVLCGSSALGEELPWALGLDSNQPRELPIQKYNGTGILCVAGSLMPQTRAQIEYAVANGVISYELDTVRLLESETIQIGGLSTRISKDLRNGLDVVLHSSYDPNVVKKTKELGARHGLSDVEIGRVVSDSLAQVTENCLNNINQTRLLVAGGETSEAVCNRLGITGMRIWREIQPGLPSCYSLEENPRLLVLKSGSFGQTDFIIQALAHLKQQ